MRVWLRMRADAEAYPGGDVHQLRETRRALETLGVDCATDDEVHRSGPNRVDLVHLFNTTRISETYRHYLEARASNLPIVVSTIWHSVPEIRRFMAWRFRLPDFPVRSYAAFREVYYSVRSRQTISLSALLQYTRWQRTVIREADAVLPNSHAELAAIERDLRITPRAAYVIPNGVRVSALGPQITERATARRDILCVGRIEPNKNQIGVIESFLHLGLRNERLLLIGAVNASHPRYARKVFSRLQPGSIEYLGQLPQNELHARFQKARVSVLASFFETTGLAALEALANGANVVILDSPTTREYFAGYASFCNPYDVESIVTAMREALASGPKDVTSLLQRCSWAEAGRATLAAYQAVLAVRSVEASGHQATVG